MSSRGICISKNDFSYSINKLVLWKSEYTDDTIQASEGYRVGKLLDAVIAGAKQEGAWKEQRGAWDIGSTVWLFESVKHLFEYPQQRVHEPAGMLR